MSKHKVIIFKVVKRASAVGNHVWCETSVGLIKKPVNSVPSIALTAFLEREKVEIAAKKKEKEERQNKN